MRSQALSKRIHYGQFVAEAKFRSHPDEYAELIRANDAGGILELLTDRAVEAKVSVALSCAASWAASWAAMCAALRPGLRLVLAAPCGGLRWQSEAGSVEGPRFSFAPWNGWNFELVGARQSSL